MSYAELKIVEENGDVVGYKKYKNSHGGAAFIWTQLYDKYLKDHNISHDSWLFGGDKLWKLSSDKSVPYFARKVLASTYDQVIIKRENLFDLVESFEKFLEVFSSSKNIVCHLFNWIEDIREIYKDNFCQGIAFYQMSVGQDPWWVYDNEDEGRPYNLEKDEGHWFLFDEIEE